MILDLVVVGEKIFKLGIGDFSNLSLLFGIDQAHGFDVHALGSGILLILSIWPLTSSQQIYENMFEPFQPDTDSRHMQPTHQL